MPVAPSLRASVSRLAARGFRLLVDPRSHTMRGPDEVAGGHRARQALWNAKGALGTWLACASLLFAAGAAKGQTTIQEARVVASLDDAEQFADSSMYVNSSDLE